MTSKQKTRKGLAFKPPRPESQNGHNGAFLRPAVRSSNEELTAWTRVKRRAARDIGDFELNINWERRLECKKSLRLFCEVYLPEIFDMEWSKDQLKLVAKTQLVILEGGCFCSAMPRAGGKTAIVRGGTLWGSVYNLRRFIFNVGSKEDLALGTLEMILVHIENNPLIQQDFPELSWPFMNLERSNHMSKRQAYHESLTFINREEDDIRFPYLLFPTEVAEHYHKHDPDSVKYAKHLGKYVNSNGGIILRAAGIDGAIRGEADADPIWLTQPRPDLVILDDIQKDHKADSPIMCEKLVRLIDGAINGLAGKGRHIDILMPCTVIREGDVADTYLNPLLKPEFQGERCKMVLGWPEGVTDFEITNDTDASRKWNEYAEVRRTSLRDHGNIKKATEFYKKHQKVMDKGFIVTWEARYDKRTEISAQQHAMNLRLKNPSLFLSEYQQIGRQLIETESILITADQLAKKIVELKRCHLAASYQYLVNFIDVQDEILYWITFACDQDFNGTFIDYGTWPDTHHHYFTKSQTASWGMITSLFFQVKEHTRFKGKAFRNSAGRIRAPLEAKIYWALTQASKFLLNRQYIKDDKFNTVVPIRLMGIDCRWGQASEAIKRFIREQRNDRIIPYVGQSFPPTNRQLEEYERRDGWFFENMLHPNVREPAWVLRPNQGDGQIYMQADVNRLKDRLFQRLATPLGAPGAISFHTAPREYHELIVNHICSSEYPEPNAARGITKNMWIQREGSAYDNDWLDGASACVALASALGASLKTTDMSYYQPIHRKLSSVHAQKRAAQPAPKQRITTSRRGE